MTTQQRMKRLSLPILSVPILSVMAALALPQIAAAEVVQYKATLTGATEVPSNDTKGTGTVTAKYDTATKQLSYDVVYSGLTGPATMAHFHSPADPTQNAPPTIPMADPASPIHGTATLTDAQADALTGGKMYFNVHTEAHKAGEIRGQVVK